jgi:type I restriction enzyme S subunit
MPKIHYERFDNLLKFLPKSKIKAGDGQESGKYPFFTSSARLSKFIDTFNYEDESLIFGSGGNASIHYCNQKFATSTDCFVVNKDSENIDMKYVYYYLKSNIKILEDGFKGAGLKHISKKYISQIKIPLLPLEEQQRIAEHLSQIEELINKRKESIKLLDELTKNTFLEMFINNPESTTWELNKIENLAMNKKGSMRTGPFGSDLLHSEFVENGEVAVLGIDNAVNNKFMWGQRRFITNEKYEQLKRYTIYPNDIIITIMGTVGRTAVIPIDIPLAINTKHLAALTLDQKLVNSFFIAFSLRENPYILNQIKKKTRGALMDGLNLTIIKNLSLSLPPKQLQDKFAEIVTQIENTKTIYQNSLNELNNLFGSIAQKAFRGENVKEKIEKMKTYKNAEDRLKSVEKEFISKMDKIMGNKSEADLTADDKRKATALNLGYKFGLYDDESIKLIDDFLDSEEFLIADKDENELINKILEKHPQPKVFASITQNDQSKNDEVEIIKNVVNKHSNKNILLHGLINIIYEKEQNWRVRYASSELIADYDNLTEEVIKEITETIYNEEKIEEEVRLHTAYAFSDKINLSLELYEAIYWILRKQSTSLLSNKEIFIHFLEKEFKEKKESLAFDILVKNIAYDSRKMTAYKMFLFDLLKYDIDIEPLNNYDYKALKDDIFRLIKEKKIIQRLNPNTYEINLFWNFDKLEEK